MAAIKKRPTSILLKLKELTINEYIVIALVASAFISVFLLAALILLLPIFCIVTKQTEKAIPRKKHEYFLLIFTVFAFITTLLHSKDAVIGELVVKAVWLKLLGIGIMILAFDIFFFANIMTKRAFRLGLIVSTVMSITSFIVAVIQKILGIYPDPINRPGRVASVYFNENYYSTVIEFVVVIALYLLFKSKSNKLKFFYVTVIAVNIIGLSLSQCRTAYIAVTISIAAFLLIHFNKKQILGITLFILIAILLAMLFSESFNIEILERFHINTLIKDLDFRIGIWKNAFHSIKDNFFLGRGYYSYGAVMNEVPGGTEFTALHAHNLFIELLMDFGMIGAAFLFTYCILSVKNCMKASIMSKDKTSLALIISTVLCILIHGMFDITIIFPQTGFFAVFLLAIPKMFDHKEIEQ